MAYYPKQSGTTETSFALGKGYGKEPFTLDASTITAPTTWTLPDNASGYLQNDSTGALTWASSVGADWTPVTINIGDTFTVPTNTQVLFAESIDVEGTLVVDGDLIDVSPQIEFNTLTLIQRSGGISPVAGVNTLFAQTDGSLWMTNGTDITQLSLPDPDGHGGNVLTITSGGLAWVPITINLGGSDGYFQVNDGGSLGGADGNLRYDYPPSPTPPTYEKSIIVGPGNMYLSYDGGTSSSIIGTPWVYNVRATNLQLSAGTAQSYSDPTVYGAGGNIKLGGGIIDSFGRSDGGEVLLSGGDGGLLGGNVTFSGGTGVNSSGGNIIMEAGGSSVAGGAVVLTGGQGNSGGTGGNVLINSGSGTAGQYGDILIYGGNGASSGYGNIRFFGSGNVQNFCITSMGVWKLGSSEDPGTAGQVITSTGSTTEPVWGYPAPVFTLATLPTPVAGCMITVSDANSGAGALCYSDGSTWKDARTNATVV